MTKRPTKKLKAGVGRLSFAARVKRFTDAYLTNGQNAKQAAITAGYKASNAHVTGWRLLRRPEVQQVVADRAEKVAELADMNVANWVSELRSIAFFNPGELYDADGKLIPVAKLPKHVRAALALVELSEDGVKFKGSDKIAALNTVARHLGLFERDNAQQSDVKVRIEFVG